MGIVKEGHLVKQSKVLKSWRRRWFVLTPEYLCSFKNEGELRNPTDFVRLRECRTCKAADADIGKENSIQLHTTTRVFLLIANSPEEKVSWTKSITKQMIRPTVLVD